MCMFLLLFLLFFILRMTMYVVVCDVFWTSFFYGHLLAYN